MNFSEEGFVRLRAYNHFEALLTDVVDIQLCITLALFSSNLDIKAVDVLLLQKLYFQRLNEQTVSTFVKVDSKFKLA